jgi:hypothetical protein
MHYTQQQYLQKQGMTMKSSASAIWHQRFGQDKQFSAFVCNFNKTLKMGICTGLDNH